MIFFVSAVLQCNVKTFVVVTSNDFDIRTAEFCRNLVITSCNESSRRTLDPVSGNRRMMRGLFGQI